MVTVKIPPVLREATAGVRDVEIDGVHTVGGVLRALGELHPRTRGVVINPDGEISPYVGVYLNDRDVSELDDLETQVEDGDTLVLLAADPGNQPAVSHTEPYDELVRALASAAVAGKVTVIQVVGPPGVGKSSLVSMVMREAERFFEGASRQSLEDPGAPASTLFSLLGGLSLGDIDTDNLAQAERDYRDLVAARRLLIVLDGAENVHDIEFLIPARGASCVVITSRRVLDLPGSRVMMITNDGRGPALDRADERPLMPKPVLPGYASDTTTGADRLGIDRDVDALALLIASSETTPPLSIGLFGDWGTGKSFFLRAISGRVEGLARMSREASARGESTAYCPSVRQITFNAWHFADANLWASLVSRIWEGLAETDDGRSSMARRLETSRLALEELTQSRREAEQREGSLGEQVSALAAANDGRYAELARVRADGDGGPALRTEAGSAIAAVRPEIEPSSEVGAEDLRGIVSDLATVRGHLLSLWNAARGHPRGPLAGLIVGVALAGGALLLVPGVADAVAGGLSLLVAAGAFYAGLRGPIADVRAATTWAKEAAADLDRRAESAQRSEEERIRHAIDRNATRIAELEAQRDAARDEARRATAEIQEIESGRAPHRFIAERLASDDYERHLGIMALIRRDFECLTELLRESREGEPGPDGGVPSIDRVVLYVDDLDRCPAPRVVEVLEAVHLLLAFDLFVVIVAVDARWLLRSLEQHYAAELSSASTPQNYLEKIFQIPFAVWPMGRDGFECLIDGLFEDTVDEPAVAGAARTVLDDVRVDRADLTLDGLADELAARDDGTRESIADLLNPPALRVTAGERALMRELHPLLPTPRAVKRFANTYRLLRASLRPSELESFARDAQEFGAVQILLATTIGIEDASDAFARLAVAGARDRPSRVVASAPPEGAGSASLARLGGLMAELEDAQRLPLEPQPYVRWTPSVARYSFTSAQLAGSR